MRQPRAHCEQLPHPRGNTPRVLALLRPRGIPSGHAKGRRDRLDLTRPLRQTLCQVPDEENLVVKQRSSRAPLRLAVDAQQDDVPTPRNLVPTLAMTTGTAVARAV